MGAVVPEDFCEVGLIVPDPEEASAELSAAVGLTFTEVIDGYLPTRDADGVESAPRPRMAYSRQFPYLEVIEEQPGTRLTKPTGTAPHHLGVWCDHLGPACDRAARRSGGGPAVAATRRQT